MAAQPQTKAPIRKKSAPAKKPVVSSYGFDRLFELSIDMLCVAGFDGHFKLLNPAWEKTLGWSKRELLARPWLDFVHLDDREATVRAGEELKKGQAVLMFRNRFCCRDGSYRWLSWNSFPLPEKRLILSVSRDISEQHKAEVALQESERNLQTILRAAPVGIGLTQDRVIRWINRRFIEMLGYREDELIGQSARMLYESEAEYDRVGLVKYDKIRAGGIGEIETRWRRKDGSLVDVHLSSTAIDPGNVAGGVIFTALDISERTRIESDLHASEERFRGLFEESSDTVFFTNPAGDWIDVNPAGIRMFGFTSKQEMLKVNIIEMYADRKDRKRILDALDRHGFVRDFELKMRRRDGQGLVVMVNGLVIRDDQGHPRQYRGIMRDVTDRQKLEQQLIQSQKMDAVGRLAGGIAHDFNNLLTTIIGNAELLLLKGVNVPAFREKIKTIKDTGERAAMLTRQLLTLSRLQVLEPVLLDFNQVINGMDRIFTQILGPDIRRVFQLAPAPHLIQADQGQLEQVLLNLVANAREAMPQGGTLTVTTANVQLDKNDVGIHPEVKPGNYLLLTISDSGKGMPAEVRDHLFEPFFSTKSGGTGLGLSTVYGIVRRANGHIMVASEEGEGTTFKLFFPAVLETTVPQPPATEPVESAMPPGHETILVVEDDKEILTLTVNILTGLGYTVLAAVDKDEALSMITANQPAIDLLLSDVILPGHRGPELAAQLRIPFPQMKILFMSGYADDRVVSSEIPGRPAHFLAKPFSPSGLAKKVRRVLDQN